MRLKNRQSQKIKVSSEKFINLLLAYVLSLNAAVFAFSMEDALFKTVTSIQGTKPWGKFLDSGTGTHSLRWVNALSTDGWTAVTADRNFAENMKKELKLSEQQKSQIVIGNWADEDFLEGQSFDTILADYLIGAIDGFSPYFQDEIIGRLKRHLSPNGRLYVIGMQPVPDDAEGPAKVITEVRQLRDACILIAGHRPYREFPLDWVVRQLERNDLRVLATKSLPILHSEMSILRQVDVASRKLPLFKSRELAKAMEIFIEDLRQRVVNACKSAKGGKIQLGFDYVVVAELASGIGNGDVKEMEA